MMKNLKEMNALMEKRNLSPLAAMLHLNCLGRQTIDPDEKTAMGHAVARKAMRAGNRPIPQSRRHVHNKLDTVPCPLTMPVAQEQPPKQTEQPEPEPKGLLLMEQMLNLV